MAIWHNNNQIPKPIEKTSDGGIFLSGRYHNKVKPKKYQPHSLELEQPKKFNLKANWPLPHLQIFILKDRKDLPKHLLKWQITECLQIIRIIKRKHSDPHHGTIAFSSDPTVLMWENYLITLERFTMELVFDWQRLLIPGRCISYTAFRSLRVEFETPPPFLKNLNVIASHTVYLNYLLNKSSRPAPKIYFPTVTQRKKAIYPTKGFSE